MDDWRKQIAIAHLVKQRIAELDVEELWPHCLPEVAATPQEIAHAEDLIGNPIDAKYRAFMSFANGWRGFYHSVDLFGTADLVSGPRLQKAMELLATLEPLEQICGFTTPDVLPIAVSQNSIDVFVISHCHTQQPGEVIWLAGQMIDRFPDFDEYFLAMVDYNREEAQALGHE